MTKATLGTPAAAEAAALLGRLRDALDRFEAECLNRALEGVREAQARASRPPAGP